MSDDKVTTIGIDIEKHPEGPFDLLNMTLPLPRLLFLPKEARDHLRAACLEDLLTFRSMLDAFIERLEQPEKPVYKAERVKIE